MFVFPDCSIENGWKGISVLHTTRDEVEKILGKPTDEDGEVNYRTDDALIHITYSNLPCSNTKKYQGSYKVIQNTVLQYRVIVKKELKLSEFKWQKDLYDRYEEPHVLGYTTYGNFKDGIRIRTEKLKNEDEMVILIAFEPTKEQNAKFLCENE